PELPDFGLQARNRLTRPQTAVRRTFSLDPRMKRLLRNPQIFRHLTHRRPGCLRQSDGICLELRGVASATLRHCFLFYHDLSSGVSTHSDHGQPSPEQGVPARAFLEDLDGPLTFGELLESIRESEEMSRKEFAEKLGISPQRL